MTTRKHPHDPHEPELRSETVDAPDSRAMASMEAKIAELGTCPPEDQEPLPETGRRLRQLQEAAPPGTAGHDPARVRRPDRPAAAGPRRPPQGARPQAGWS